MIAPSRVSDYKKVTLSRVVHVQLGRNGDLVLLLPCWREIYEQTGEKPVVVVAREFADLFRGVSYVEPDVINGHWYAQVLVAAQMAKLKYGQCVITQCHGVGHDTSQTAYPSFGEAMWAKAGFPGRYGGLPMVFDRRNGQREQKLLDQHGSDRPMLLFNFAGLSSPLPCSQQIRHRLRRFERDFKLVNLGAIHAVRLYDLLGLYDRAAGLITIDTATLHLAAASTVPTLAYCRGGWSSAIPKPEAVRIDYAQAHQQLDAIDRFVQTLRQTALKPC